jgi:hypothetical protein
VPAAYARSSAVAGWGPGAGSEVKGESAGDMERVV